MPIALADITAALALPPLGNRSDFDLNPEVRAALAPGLKQRPAAILCPLIERPAGLHVVLTRRATHLKHHAGQISFPGGKVDQKDPSPLATALREAEEEIGMLPDQIDVLGTLDPYLTSTGFRVTPFVGLVAPAWRALPDPNEVEEVFEAPLDFLMDPTNRLRHHREWQGSRRYFYAMPWGDYYIWGATAGMLKGLADRLAVLAEQGAA
ncbi:CoA pyrophosphatase [Limibaculum sp. M0105]|uniref:CoA pyrophosphatase n=1 Tax=Thermohalobaculum xanthum TaxID=2753746 RepID=A0A8J7M913_9RHOB|nr:CoA pyrophosphatase [Thermohalobaculum xanthum]MBK0400373.1 CoA pyrophosphatase [Thermohalobaculum xanthum]